MFKTEKTRVFSDIWRRHKTKFLQIWAPRLSCLGGSVVFSHCCVRIPDRRNVKPSFRSQFRGLIHCPRKEVAEKAENSSCGSLCACITYMCLCECVPMYVQPCMQVCACSYMWRPYVLRWGHTLNLKLNISARLASQWALVIPLSPPHQHWIADMHTHTSYMGAGEPSSGPHAIMIRTLPAKPSP